CRGSRTGAARSPICRTRNNGEETSMGQVARKAAIATLVVLGLIALALALWKLRVLVSLLFLGLVIAAAMRPGVEWLHERRVPRGVGVAIPYLALPGLFALFLSSC